MTDELKAAPGTLSEAKIIELWDAQRRYHGGEPCKVGHVEFALSVLAAAGNSQSQDALLGAAKRMADADAAIKRQKSLPAAKEALEYQAASRALIDAAIAAMGKQEGGEGE